MSDVVSSTAATFATHSALAAQLPGFQVRPSQQAMAEAIADALQRAEDLLVEAGTGTGKTLAYLIPAILSGKKIIISTGTKNLQDQLLHHDIPVLRSALSVSVSFAVLKGRANYLCVYRLEQAAYESTLDRQHHRRLTRLQHWSATTRRGDIAEFADLPETDPFWPQVTSTVDNCLGQDCPRYEDCFLVKARREAQAADIVIINHHLLLADMALQESGFGELLPAADAYIIDEAHQLPEIASQFFGTTVSSAQLIELAADSAKFYREEINENEALIEAAQALESDAAQLRTAFGMPLRRASWNRLALTEPVNKALQAVSVSLTRLLQHLQPVSERSRNLENCYLRADTLQTRLLAMLSDEPPAGYIKWYEVHRRSVSLHHTPLDVAEPFQQHKTQKRGVWIFTSATLTVAGQFEHYVSRLGLHDARCLQWDSPFDYARQGLLYIPPQMPDPNTPRYTAAVIACAEQVLQYSRGRAFVLFTSHRALQEAAAAWRHGFPFPLLVQGDAARDSLLSQFRTTAHAVLLGTSSFWEGVDVRGEALSCVIIDKLPFGSPDDPVLQARIEEIRRRGQNPFMHYQVPSAVIALKQGVGRLIRDVHDRGVVVLCDPRLLSKPYGKLFLTSLPAMPITRELYDVQRFYTQTTRVCDGVA